MQQVLAFLEAFLTVEIAGLGGVMLHNGTYVWPAWPALAFISAGAFLAAVRRLAALAQPPPPR